MISAIVLATGSNERARECAVRSLVWLVSAVVGGAVRDVITACPPDWPIEDVMDHAGCGLVRRAGEAERLSAAVAVAKCDRVLVLRMGYQPEGPLVAEIDAAERRPEGREPTLLLAAPSRLVERLFPDSAPVVGAIVARDFLCSARHFRNLVRGTRGGIRLRTRMVPVI